MPIMKTHNLKATEAQLPAAEFPSSRALHRQHLSPQDITATMPLLAVEGCIKLLAKG